MKLPTKIIILLAIVSLHNQNYAQTELKFNIASAALLAPNFGVEFPVAKHISFQLDVLGSFRDDFNGSPLHVVQVITEPRYYQHTDNTGWFIGAHAGFGMFTLQKPSFNIIYDAYQDPATYSNDSKSFQSGRVAFYGITLGYKRYINTHWGFEAFLGGGLTQSNYKGYNGLQRVDVSAENYRDFNGSGEVALYRGGVMIIYKITQK